MEIVRPQCVYPKAVFLQICFTCTALRFFDFAQIFLGRTKGFQAVDLHKDRFGQLLYAVRGTTERNIDAVFLIRVA